MVKFNIKILADENIASGLVNGVRDAGYDVSYVVELSPGISDNAVLDLAHREGRVLITEDKDFGNLVYRLKKPGFSVILIRIAEKQRDIKLERLLVLLDKYSNKLEGNYVVVESDKIRFRPLLKLK